MRSLQGDIVLVYTTPPHIASISDGDKLVCEDGTILGAKQTTYTKLYDALEIVQSMEDEVCR